MNPSTFSNKRLSILAIGSHPDDLEFGCGGMLSRCSSQGHDVFMLVMTSGSKGGSPQIRKREQLKSAGLLGVKEVFWGGFEDTKLPFYHNVIQSIERTIKQISPTHVFVHHGKDTHQDHRHVSTCTVAATRNVANVLFFEGPTTYGFEPNLFFDVGACLEKKFEALSCHRSQIMRTNIQHQSILEIAKATAIFRGTQCRMPFAEAFLPLRMILFE
jgi:LmbE family N-acetylglucosaminyl deacetylase